MRAAIGEYTLGENMWPRHLVYSWRSLTVWLRLEKLKCIIRVCGGGDFRTISGSGRRVDFGPMVLGGAQGLAHGQPYFSVCVSEDNRFAP